MTLPNSEVDGTIEYVHRACAQPGYQCHGSGIRFRWVAEGPHVLYYATCCSSLLRRVGNVPLLAMNEEKEATPYYGPLAGTSQMQLRAHCTQPVPQR